MLTYQSPLRDIQFVVHELLDTQAMLRHCNQEEFDTEAIDHVLVAAGQFASEVIAPLNAIGDKEGCSISADGSVKTPAGFRDAYKRFTANGWHGLGCSREFGGQGFPSIISSAVAEIFGGANMAWASYPSMSNATFVNIEANASAELKAEYLPKLASGEWAGTMCLTEPNAGTDLGLLRTRAVPLADGSFLITGTKIFISGGDHDLTDNIVHLVLARLPDAPPGVKGISLFLVPKYLPSPDGSGGTSNRVTCSSVEEKMGIHGNSTCTINFEESTGWLVGERHKGLAGMFVQMNHARIQVGIVAIGVMEAAYQKALSYAKERVQGRAAGVASGAAADPIIHHADVRRMLLTQKANIEGMRALALLAAQLSDGEHMYPEASMRAASASLLGLLTPIVKSMASDLGLESTLLAMQVFGGHGYIRENGVEQHVRDVRIVGLYEGTNGVQAMDLLGRKVLHDGGERLSGFFELVSKYTRSLHDDGKLAEFVGPLADLATRVETLTRELMSQAKNDPHAVGAAAAPYLRLVGHLVLAWLWARAAEKSFAGLDSGDPIYASKITTARFYYQRQLPQTLALIAEIRAGSSVLTGP